MNVDCPSSPRVYHSNRTFSEDRSKMKLRIKYQSNRHTIEINDTATLGELVERCKSIAAGDWFLSLNGSVEIPSPPEVTLSSVGLVNGDLLHVVERKTNSNNDLLLQLLQMGFEKSSVNKVVHSFGATNINDAIELLSMIGSTAQGHSSESRNTSTTSSVSEVTTDVAEKNNVVETSSSSSLAASSSSTVAPSVAADVMDTEVPESRNMSPLFLQDGVTDSLKELLNQVQCENDADYLCLAVHSLMREAGFLVQNTGVVETTDRDDVEERQPVARLPATWRNAAMGLYRLNYVHGTSAEIGCCLTATVTGRSLLVAGTLDEEDSDAHQLKLKISDFVNVGEATSGSATSVYSNLGRLSRKFKDNISTKLINEIKFKLGRQNEISSLTNLPQEVQMRLMNYLDVHSLCVLSQVCRDINRVCNDESVWKAMLSREFRASNVAGTTYKQAVKHMYVMRREERLRQQRELERSRIPRTPFALRPDFEVGPDLIYPSIPPRVPGMIGGFSDLNPTGGFQPGGIPTNPLLGTSQPDILRGRYPTRGDLRRPPGARFDPYGPLPDDDFDVTPNVHPDTLHRPGFGRGNGFGGGFGFL